MSKPKIYLLLIALLTCVSCDIPDNPHNTDDWYETPALSRLDIEGYPFSIYKFFTWSMYNDSQFMGYTLLDTNRTFTLNEMKKLDFDFFKELPTNDTLKIIKLVAAKDEFQVKQEPVRTTFKQRNGITIQTEYLEEYNGYSTTKSSGQWFRFSSLTEKADSIIFYGTTRTSISGKPELQQDLDSIVLPKRNLYLKLDVNSSPGSISAEVLIEEEADLFVYKQGTNILESTIKNGFVRIKRYYEFTPADSTVNMALSGRGLFREIE